jgi:glucose dehydrogenase
MAALVVLAAAAAALAATAGQASAPVGQAPPEWAANAGAWPAHNYDLANTRATTQTPINSQTVSQLKVKWTFAFKGASGFGAFSSTPISLNGTVYLQDLNSNVFALDRTTGKVKWQHKFNKPSGQRRRHRLGARRRDRPDQVEVQHHLRRRQALRQSEDQQRRRSLVPAVG